MIPGSAVARERVVKVRAVHAPGDPGRAVRGGLSLTICGMLVTHAPWMGPRVAPLSVAREHAGEVTCGRCRRVMISRMRRG